MDPFAGVKTEDRDQTDSIGSHRSCDLLAEAETDRIRSADQNGRFYRASSENDDNRPRSVRSRFALPAQDQKIRCPDKWESCAFFRQLVVW